MVLITVSVLTDARIYYPSKFDINLIRARQRPRALLPGREHFIGTPRSFIILHHPVRASSHRNSIRENAKNSIRAFRFGPLMQRKSRGHSECHVARMFPSSKI